MSIQWSEFQAAFMAWRAQRDKYDIWMEVIAAGEPFDREQLQRDIEELDALHRVFIERSKPFTRLKSG